jgi:hypothetical protein
MGVLRQETCELDQLNTLQGGKWPPSNVWFSINIFFQVASAALAFKEYINKTAQMRTSRSVSSRLSRAAGKKNSGHG